jgi:hypothetical protein
VVSGSVVPVKFFSDSRHRWKNWLVIAVALLAFTTKISIALSTRGSNDVIIWQAHLAKIRTEGVQAWYRDGVRIQGKDGHFLGIEASNQPVLAFRMVSALEAFGQVTGLPFSFWLRFLASTADLASIFFLRAILARSGLCEITGILILVAASPVSIMISGFHGNTDPIVVFLLVLTIWLAVVRRSAWLVGAAFGLAISIKVVPVVFAPVILLYLPALKERLKFASSAFLVFVVGGMPYSLQFPVLLVEHLFGYSPQAQAWGIPGLVHIFLPSAFDAFYQLTGKIILFSMLLLGSFRMPRPASEADLFRQCGLIAFLFLFFATGFGVQYLAWLVPWSAGWGRSRPPFYYFASSAFLFTVYTVWSGGFPWNFGNSLEYKVSFVPGIIMFSLEVTCWISIASVAYELWFGRNRIDAHGKPAIPGSVR